MSGRDVVLNSNVRGSTIGDLYAVRSTEAMYRTSASWRRVTGAVEMCVALVQVNKWSPNLSSRTLQPRRVQFSPNSLGEHAYNEKYKRNASSGIYVRRPGDGWHLSQSFALGCLACN